MTTQQTAQLHKAATTVDTSDRNTSDRATALALVATIPHLYKWIAMGAVALALALNPLGVKAEITQDCILEGTVDKRKAEQLGQSVYVKFRNARRGSEAGCSMNRRSKSRRVQFISSPPTDGLENASHGSKVRYRYIERNNEPGTWELIRES